MSSEDCLSNSIERQEEEEEEDEEEEDEEEEEEEEGFIGAAFAFIELAMELLWLLVGPRRQVGGTGNLIKRTGSRWPLCEPANGRSFFLPTDDP